MKKPPSMLVLMLALSLHQSGSACRPPSPDAPKVSSNKSNEPITSTPISVEAYSGRNISRYGPIRVIFNQNIVLKEKVGQPIQLSPFTFEPNISGRAIWTSPKEIQYQLETPLEASKKISATLNLEHLPKPSTTSKLHFDFWPTELLYDVDWVGWTGTTATSTYDGVITTTDKVKSELVEKMLSFEGLPDNLTPAVRWIHSESGIRHRFVISNLKRTPETLKFNINVTGKPIGVNNTFNQQVSIPAEKALFAYRGQLDNDNSLLIRFSDPLDPKQEFSKYIKIKNHTKMRFSVSGTTLRIFSEHSWASPTKVKIQPGIRKLHSQQTTRSTQQLEITVHAKSPQAKFLSKGVIIPSKNQPILPIETINLNHIWVAATHVPNANINQFLQVNDIDGHKEMVRVGRVIWRKRVKLDMQPNERNRWVRRGLDLRDLTAKNQSGLYRLHLYFAPSDTYNTCTSDSFSAFDEDKYLETIASSQESAQELSFWDGWENIAGSEDNWNYYQRHNPCNISYYRYFNDHSIQVSKNVFLSDIGIIAKKGESGDILIAATSLNTTAPLEDAKVTIVNYSNETLAQGRTNKNGLAHLKVSSKNIFSARVEYGNQTGILKLTDGRSLSVAHFDAGGVAIEEGIKGYIYGERGVWRPGDTMHLGFVLFDTQQHLPKDHPVELRIRNPRGQLIHRTLVQTPPPIYRFDVKTNQDAPTGEYKAEVRIGPVRFKKTLRVETVVPNRLKIDLDFGTKLFQGPVANLTATLKARWLHGAIARGLKASVDVGFASIPTRFTGFSDYTFDDPTRKYRSRPEALYAGVLDKQGHLRITTDFGAKTPSPGMLQASFITRVFEEGGQASTDRYAVKFSPYTQYIGIKTPRGDAARGMLLTDKTHIANIVSVNTQGQPTDTTVQVQLYKIRWRWWWEKGAENLADYASDKNHNLISSVKVNLKDGKGEFPFEIKYPQWGRYLLLVSDQNGQHRSGKIMYIDWPGWAGRQQKEDGGAAHRLTITADKKRVKVGESVKLSFPSPQTGRALLSLENGVKVVSTRWVELKKGSTQVDIVTSPEMTPNIYANITILQPYQNKTNDRPMRLYGLTPIQVTNPETQLFPKLSTPTSIEPESTFNIKIAEENGQPMSYTLAIVDEGLLGLTRQKTPNPWQHFFQKEALGVKTWDIYNQVAGGYAGALETMLAIGGGANADEDESAKGLRFKPVVKVLGPFNLAADEISTHSIKLPPYLGEVRVMAVAASSTAFGATEASIRVSKPLMILSTLPRVMSPNESVKLPVTIFASDDTVKNVELNLKTSGPIQLTRAGSQKVDFSGPGEKTIQFPVKVSAAHDSIESNKKTLKPIDVSLSASSDDGKYHVKEETTVPLRFPTPQKSNTLTKIIQPGSSWLPKVSPIGIPGTNQYTLEISRTPPLQLERHLSWLIKYPHGCLEQTVSKAFPQLFLSHLLSLSSKQDKAVRNYVTEAIEKLKNFQQPSGQFSYWPGGHNQHSWSNIWAGHFLVEASQAGYAVDDEVLTHWLEQELTLAEEWTKDDGHVLTQIYRLYVLALAGRPRIAAMNRLRGGNELTLSEKLRLGTTYALAGEHSAAETLISSPFNKGVHDYETFGTPLRDLAMALESYLLLGKEELSLELAQRLADELTKDQLTTHEVSYGLLALAKLAMQQSRRFLNSPPQTKVSWQKRTKVLTLTKPITQVSLPAPTQELLSLSVDNISKSTLFASLVQKGQPPAEASPGTEKGLKIDVTYYRHNEKILLEDIHEGDDIVARINLKNKSPLLVSDIAISHLIPSGMVLRHDRLSGRQLESSSYDYQDVRDDRVYTYLSLKPGSETEIRVRLHAQFQGHFFMPPIRAEAMYDAQVYAETESKWFKITAIGEQD